MLPAVYLPLPPLQAQGAPTSAYGCGAFMHDTPALVMLLWRNCGPDRRQGGVWAGQRVAGAEGSLVGSSTVSNSGWGGQRKGDWIGLDCNTARCRLRSEHLLVPRGIGPKNGILSSVQQVFGLKGVGAKCGMCSVCPTNFLNPFWRVGEGIAPEEGERGNHQGPHRKNSHNAHRGGWFTFKACGCIPGAQG